MVLQGHPRHAWRNFRVPDFSAPRITKVRKRVVEPVEDQKVVEGSAEHSNPNQEQAEDGGVRSQQDQEDLAVRALWKHTLAV